MELKPFLGKYKAKEVDEVIHKLQQEKIEINFNAEKQLSDLRKENEKLKAELEAYKAKESVIAQVMLDATQRAKEIEEDYRNRAKQSDDACKQLHSEWVSGMQSAAANLNRMKAEAKEMLDAIDSQFSTLCTWADNKLESLENASLPESSADISINAEIKQGISADLGELCREMGIYDESQDANHDAVLKEESTAEEENLSNDSEEENNISEESAVEQVESKEE